MSSGNPEPPLLIEYQTPDRDEVAVHWQRVYRGIIRYYAVLAACSIVYYFFCVAVLGMRWRYYPALPVSKLQDLIIDFSQSPLIPPLLFASGLISCTFYDDCRRRKRKSSPLLIAASLHVAIATIRIAADIYVLQTVQVPLFLQIRGSRGIQEWNVSNATWDMLVCVLFGLPLLLCPLSTLSRYLPPGNE